MKMYSGLYVLGKVTRSKDFLGVVNGIKNVENP